LKSGQISGLSFRMYLAGYKGVLTGVSIEVPESEWETTPKLLNTLGGSPIGNSRVKLTNTEDCVKKGYFPQGHTALEVAATQLIKDNVHVLHTIGGDDTNTQAATLSEYIAKEHGGQVVVIGMPKTIDNVRVSLCFIVSPCLCFVLCFLTVFFSINAGSRGPNQNASIHSGTR